MSGPSLLLTLGDPAGIGPEIVLSLLEQGWPGPGRVHLIGDRELLLTVAGALSMPPPAWLVSRDEVDGVRLDDLGAAPADLPRGAPHPVAARAALAYLERALEILRLGGPVQALVTGPVNKAAMAAAGIPFAGHTEWLAEATGSAGLVPLFDAPGLRVAVATGHVPLASVPAAASAERVGEVVRRVHAALVRDFGVAEPRISLLGLNPHAGEAGTIGREELTVLAPLAETLRSAGIRLAGPLPPDSAFAPHWRQRTDAYVALYHDQGLIPVKALAFDSACQVTLGLPWVRTSPDHGTAYDRVGQRGASTGSLERALSVAARLAARVDREGPTL